MSGSGEKQASPLSRALGLLGCLGGLGLGCAILGSFFAPLEAVVLLLLGWIGFLRRVVPEINVDWVSVVSGVVFLVAFGFGFHFLGRSLLAGAELEDRPTWSWRWSVYGVALVVLTFAAGIAAVGAIHQVVWLARSPEPLVRSSWNRGNEVAAIGALKTIGSAQSLFREDDKEGDGELDYGTLAELASAGTTGLIDSVLGSGTKNGYEFEATYSAKTSQFLWFATARPAIPGTTGERYFCTNHEGVIFYSKTRPFRLNRYDCTIPAGATPVGK